MHVEGGRALGVDYGAKRIGLALSDPTGTLATPWETMTRRAGKRPPVARLAQVATEKRVAAIVFGLPLGLDGEENEWCAEVRSVGEAVGDRAELPVWFVDERMTSVRAEREIRSSGLKKTDREDKARIDATAASIILQAWLDSPGIAR